MKMEKKERNLIINILWKPFFAAVTTASLTISTEIHPIIIGLALGAASSIACYLDLKRYIDHKMK